MQKKVILSIAVFLLLFISACQVEQVQPPSSEGAKIVQDSQEPAVEEINKDLSEDQQLEQPAVDQVMENKPEEDLSEEPQATSAENGILNTRMKEGDKVEYKGHTIEMVDVLAGLSLELRVDGQKLLMQDTGTSELASDIRITYVNAFDYNSDNAVNMRLEPFTLGEHEYLLDKGSTVTVNGYQVKLSDVRFDDRNKIGYVYADTPYTVSVVRIVEGKTETVGNATVTAVETFYQYQPYAVLKIVV